MPDLSDIDPDDISTPMNMVKNHPNWWDGDGEQVKRKALRWQIYRADINGLSEAGAIIGSGRNRRIVVSRYQNWMLENT